MQLLHRLEAGDEITCPNCDKVIVTCLEPPQRGEQGYASKFTPDLTGEPTVCVDCNTAWAAGDWYMVKRIHVRGKGWVL